MDTPDAPKSFRHWPLEFLVVEQSETADDTFNPSLDEIFGPKSRSVHLPLEGLVGGKYREGHFYPDEDISPFPVRAGQIILNHLIRLTSQELGAGTGGTINVAQERLKQMRKQISFVEPILDILERWQVIFSELSPDAPVGSELGSAFNRDLATLSAIFKGPGRRIRIGAGTTITGGAALEAYFAMYAGQRGSFESIPPALREYIERERMRTAFSVSMTHQIGGYGANVQESEMLARGMILLLQLATDEATGFMWGDVGVLQYWIDPLDLEQGNWDKVEFLMHGH